MSRVHENSRQLVCKFFVCVKFRVAEWAHFVESSSHVQVSDQAHFTQLASYRFAILLYEEEVSAYEFSEPISVHWN